MEVERARPVWPYWVSLAGLLMLAMAAPKYWAAQREGRLISDHADAPAAGTSRFADPHVSGGDSAPAAHADASSSASQRAARSTPWIPLGPVLGATPAYGSDSLADLLGELRVADLVELPAAVEDRRTAEVEPPYTVWIPPAGDAVSSASQGVHLSQPGPDIESPSLANLVPRLDLEWVLAALGRQCGQGTAAMPRAIPLLMARLHAQPQSDSQPGLAAILPKASPAPLPAGGPVLASPPARIVKPQQRAAPPVNGLAMVPSEVSQPSQRTAQLPTSQLPPLQLADSAPSPLATRPAELEDRLSRLADFPATRRWATAMQAAIDALFEQPPRTAAAIDAALVRLAELGEEGRQLAGEVGDEPLRVELLRAYYGLVRRLSVWGVVLGLETRSEGESALVSLGREPETQNARPVTVRQLAARIEDYELSRDPQLARTIAQQRLRLATSAAEVRYHLAAQIDQQYRNANVRVEVSRALFNRLLPRPDRAETNAVNERIAGARVQGHSTTATRLEVDFEPDPSRIRMALRAEGRVDAQTFSNEGPVFVHSRGDTRFLATKRLLITREGLRVLPAAAAAKSDNRLAGVETYYDGLPLVGSLIRSAAEQEYRARRQRARWEVETRVADEASSRLDEETQPLVERLRRRLDDSFLADLGEYGIATEAIELTTSDEAAVARLRVAAADQLAAHTPRPTPPAGSLASLYINETALTNAARALELDGRRLNGIELRALLAEKFPRLQMEAEIEDAENTIFQFAAQEAAQVRFEEGRMELILALDELVRDRQPVRDFKVHVMYRPVADGLEAELLRDGAFGMEGRLRASDRGRLHAIFEAVLPEDRPLRVLRLDDPPDPRFAGLMITQIVLEDGWLGIALGNAEPGRSAQLSRGLR